MGWLKRDRIDTNALFRVVTRGSYEEFMSVYDPAHVDYSFSLGSLLSLALGHSDLAARVAIANQLLDDGADVRTSQPLHVLLGQDAHDFEAEPKLLERMLDWGADVNEVMPKFGTPLEALAEVFKFSDETLAPFYDVLFAQPDLDLLQQGSFSTSVYANIRQVSARRGDLLARADAYLQERGLPAPDGP